jgi:hypothetical protein
MYRDNSHPVGLLVIGSLEGPSLNKRDRSTGY